MLPGQLLGQRLPAQLGAAVGVRDVAHDVRARRVAQVARQLRGDQDVGRRGHALEGLEHQQAAQPVADDDRRRTEALHRGDDVLGVRADVERRRVGGLRPEVVAQVEGVALPAAAGEVVEVPLPDPRAAELAVDEQDRLAPRPPLGQPRFDVQAAVDDLDLVLADGPPVGRAGAGEEALGCGVVCHRSCLAYHSCGLNTSPVRALG